MCQRNLKIANRRKKLIEYPSRYPTGATSTIPTKKPISNPKYQTGSDPYDIKQGIQEAQVSL